LPADFETFGQAVATSMADLLGGTSGQILAKASNTDMDFTWITNDVGDITAVNTTAPLAGGGTSGALTLSIAAATTSVAGAVQLSDSTSTTSSVLAATPTAVKSAYDLANGAIPKSLIDAAGDLIVGTAADTAGRLGIGTAGQVLKVNTGATALEWGSAASSPTFKGCSVYNSANQSVANTTLTIATFNTENFDTDGFHSTSTNTGRMTIPTGLGGKYLVTFNLKFTGTAAATARVAYLRKNAGSLGDFIFQNSVNAPAIWSRSAIVDLVAGDYIFLEIYQESGGSLDYQGTSNMYEAFSIQYLGA
jgi:hypothetical protein